MSDNVVDLDSYRRRRAARNRLHLYAGIPIITGIPPHGGLFEFVTTSNVTVTRETNILAERYRESFRRLLEPK